MNVTRIAGHRHVGGIFVNSEMVSAFTCEGSIIFDWNRLKKSEFTRLCTAIKQGFTLSEAGPVMAILKMLQSIDGVPVVPPIGYVGKKNLTVIVPASKAERYKSDLIAAAHMVDVDLTKAVSIVGVPQMWQPGYHYLTVASWHVKSHGDEAAGTARFRRRSGAHLKPATSKLVGLIRQWQEELYPLREPLLKFVERRPTLTFDLRLGTDV